MKDRVIVLKQTRAAIAVALRALVFTIAFPLVFLVLWARRRSARSESP